MRTALTSTDTVRTYLREIGRVPLLTHEQEIVFGKQVQQMVALRAIEAQLSESLGRQPTVEEWAAAAETDVEQLQRLVSGGEAAKRKW